MKQLLTLQTATATVLALFVTITSCKKNSGDPPEITGLSVDTAWVGKTITINGSRFSATSTDNVIKIGNTVVTEIVAASENALTFKVPAQATSGKVFVSVHGRKQQSPRELVIVNQLEWQKVLGGALEERGFAIAHSKDGGYFIAGSSQSSDGDVTTNHGLTDVWIVKLNADRTIAWQKVIGGSGYDDASSIVALADGSCVAAGYTTSNDGDITGNHGGSDYFVVKLDASGNIVWKTVLGGTDFEEAKAIIATSTGFVVAGHTLSNDGNVTGNNHGLSDYWVVWLDANGSLVRQKTYGGTGYDNGYTIATAGNGYLVAGSSSSTDGDVSGNHGNTDSWIVKLNSTGNIEWQKSYGGTRGETTIQIISTADGGSLAAGFAQSNDGDVTGNHGSYDYWVIKLNSNGSAIWKKAMGGTDLDQASAIAPTSDGGCVVAGSTTSNDGDVTDSHGGADSWIVRLNAEGNIVWKKSAGGKRSDVTYDIIPEGNDFIALGMSSSNDGDVSGLHGDKVDYWMFKILD